MTTEELRNEVFRLLEKTSGRKHSLTEDTNLFMSGVLDSYTIVNFVMAIEERFNVSFNFQDIKESRLQTPNKIVEVLKTIYGL